MAVLMEFAMFPTDKGASVSEYVSQIIKMIRESGHTYQLTPMGTIIETETIDQCLEMVQKSHDILEPHSDRIYTAIKMDIKKDQDGMLKQKIESIEKKIGEVSK